MSDKKIQIVDVIDNPIATASKKQAWEQGLIHRIVRISVFDEVGNMLVQKRSKQQELFPGCWDNSVAGHVDAGETYDSAAERELKEELGLQNQTLQNVGNYYVELTNELRILKRFTNAYKIVLKNPLPKFKLGSNEVDEICWMKINEVKKLVNDSPEMTSDGLQQIIKLYYS